MKICWKLNIFRLTNVLAHIAKYIQKLFYILNFRFRKQYSKRVYIIHIHIECHDDHKLYVFRISSVYLLFKSLFSISLSSTMLQTIQAHEMLTNIQNANFISQITFAMRFKTENELNLTISTPLIYFWFIRSDISTLIRFNRILFNVF